MLYDKLIKPELICEPMNAQIIQCKILSSPRVLYSEKHQIKFIWKTPLKEINSVLKDRLSLIQEKNVVLLFVFTFLFLWYVTFHKNRH